MEIVILPMVLQIRETMVLQGVELEGKRKHVTFLGFRPASCPDEEAWLCRKTSPKVEMVT
jgi:hypothetical protein